MTPLAPVFQSNINRVEDFGGGVKVGRAFTTTPWDTTADCAFTADDFVGHDAVPVSDRLIYVNDLAPLIKIV